MKCACYFRQKIIIGRKIRVDRISICIRWYQSILFSLFFPASTNGSLFAEFFDVLNIAVESGTASNTRSVIFLFLTCKQNIDLSWKISLTRSSHRTSNRMSEILYLPLKFKWLKIPWEHLRGRGELWSTGIKKFIWLSELSNVLSSLPNPPIAIASTRRHGFELSSR